MPKIHYFQRYSTPENTVTNNTLQLLSRVYSYSTVQASRLLTEITGESIEIGVEISQQTRSAQSVPDGQVVQRSFKVLVEAKVDSPVDQDQLLRHAAHFTNESQKILLLLTKQPLSEQETLAIRARIDAEYPDVIFKAVTYEGICRAVAGLFKEYEYEIRDLVDDYVEYCNETELFDQSSQLMRIVPCGTSLEINLRHGVYFHPSDRGYTNHAYVGTYANKAVHAVWAIDAVFDVDLVDERLDKRLVQGRNTDEYDENIISIIGAAKRECGFEVASGNRFFCGKPQETCFRKVSSGGMQGARFVSCKRRSISETQSQDVRSPTGIPLGFAGRVGCPG